MTLFFLLTLILLVSPNSTTFAQMKDQENTYRINDEMILTINHHNQGDIIVANHSENEDNEPLHHGEHQDHPATSSHDSHTAHSEYGGPGGESKAAIYASALSVVMIFLFIGVTYIALRKHQKNSNKHYR